MTTVVLTQPVEGKQPLETAEVDEGRAKFLIHEGYAFDPDSTEDKVHATSAHTDDHPMLAENREGVDEETPTPDGDGNAPEVGVEGRGTFKSLRERQEEADRQSEALVERTKDLVPPEHVEPGDNGNVHIKEYRRRQAAADEESAAHLEAGAQRTAPEQITELPRTLPKDAEEKAKQRADRRAGGAAAEKPGKKTAKKAAKKRAAKKTSASS